MQGDMVSPNVQALRLDDLSKLYVDLSVTEVDINKIQVGQTAEVTLDAIPDANYSAQVMEVGQVGEVTGGVVYFNVTVLLDKPDAKVRPGMTASAGVQVGRQENVLLVPNRSLRAENGKQVIYVPDSQIGLRPVTVQVGDSDETMTMITGGLSEGDEFITDPPSTNSIDPGAMQGIFGGGPGGGDVERAPVQQQP
jgi:HlyD family secretion protein